MKGFKYKLPENVDVLLVAPDGGTGTIVMSDIGGDNDAAAETVNNLNLTFDDEAAVSAPADLRLMAGTVRPTDDDDDAGESVPNHADTFPAPATAPSGNSLSVFDGLANANGAWRLYIVNDEPKPPPGQFSGWCIDITTTGESSPTTTTTTLGATTTTTTTTTATATATSTTLAPTTTVASTTTTVPSPPTTTAPSSTAPPNLTVTDRTTSTVGLRWDPVAGASEYRAYVSRTSGVDYVLWASGFTGTSATLHSLTGEYYVVVRAVVGGVESPNSNEVLAKSSLGSPQGFGAATTGGIEAAPVYVTSLADSGPGTLREAVERPEPADVRFRVAGTIFLQTHLYVGPNKTIDGRGAYPVTISNRGFILAESNVIIESLRFDGFGDLTVVTNPQDAIEIRGAQRVWISHNQFSNAADKAIQVTSGTDITVWGNHFRNQTQVFQAGCYSCPDGTAIRMSVHDNYFEGGGRGYRMPTINYGYAHAWNNYLVDWAYFGMASSRFARLLTEANVFQAGESKRAAIHNSNTPDDKDPGFGYLRSVDDLKLNGAVVEQYEPGLVGAPPYAATVVPASTSLAESIAANSGPRPA